MQIPKRKKKVEIIQKGRYMIVQPWIIESWRRAHEVTFQGSFFTTATVAVEEELLHCVSLTRLKTDGSMKGMLTSPDEVRRFLWNAKADKPGLIWWEKPVHLWVGGSMSLSPTVTVTGSLFSSASLLLPIASLCVFPCPFFRVHTHSPFIQGSVEASF